ncbi:hypothetical protein W823_15115 [Williamsia sp. D3]|nr:hypothetical protein W823_15115 [Williamsia sp. D3]
MGSPEGGVVVYPDATTAVPAAQRIRLPLDDESVGRVDKGNRQAYQGQTRRRSCEYV